MQIVPEDQITGLRVLFVKMEAPQKDRFHRGHPVQRQYRHTVYHTRSFLLYSKKLELSREMRVIPTFAFYGTLTMGAAWFFEWKNGIPIVQLQGYRSGNQNGRKNADIGQPWGLFFSQYQAYHTLNEYLVTYPSRRIAKCFRWSVHAEHARVAFCRTPAGSAADDGTHGR